MGKLNITIADILKRKSFKDAELIAGKKGRRREVKWTHILEMEAFDFFINGGELVLTTGSNLQFESSTGISQLEKLIESNVAGICLELGTHVNHIHPSIIEFADRHDFPIIIFKKVVKFVDITQDLHSIIVNNHYERLNHLHNLSKEFIELSLAANGILKIIKKLYDYFGKNVFLITDEKKLYYYPVQSKETAALILANSEENHETNAYTTIFVAKAAYSVFPIRGLGYSWANLYIQEHADNIDEFSFSILDRATLAIAQVLLRNRTIEERKQNQEENLVQQLLHGEEFDPSIASKLLPAPAENLYFRLIIIENNVLQTNIRGEEWEEIKLQQSIMLRSLFKRHNFFPSISVTKRKIAVIASYYQSSYSNSDNNIFMRIIKEIKDVYEKNVFHGDNCYISASSIQKDYRKVAACYMEANEVLLLQKQAILDVVFFEEIGVYRLLNKLKTKELEDYISHYLGPIIKHEELLLTLSVYLETMGAKKETAEKLSIVRQTLYHRLDKIQDLLGDNYMQPTKRQAIELAINAYKLLKNKSN